MRRSLAIAGIGNAVESNLPLVRRELYRTLESIDVDLIHAHFGPEGDRIAPVAKRLGVPLIVSFHGFDAFELPRRPEWPDKYARLFEVASAITAVSDYMREALVRLGCPEEKIQVVRVGKRLADYPFRSWTKANIRRWLFVGRFSEKKAPLDCVKAFEVLSRDFEDQRLVMIGEGPQLAEVASFVQRGELASKVTLTGALSHDQVREEFQRADAFILASKTASNGDMEGVPTVLMEAQAIGIPCVSTWHSGIPEAIPHDNKWLLAREGDVDQIAEKMGCLINSNIDHLREIVHRGRTLIEERFNLELEARRLIRLYIQTLSDHGMIVGGATDEPWCHAE